MKHRHLNHEEFTVAAVDDIIARGGNRDWVELKWAMSKDPRVRDKITRVCRVHIDDPYAQRYHFWMQYVQRKETAA